MAPEDLPNLSLTRRVETFRVLMHAEAPEVYVKTSDGKVWTLPMKPGPGEGKQSKKQQLVAECLASDPHVYWLYYEVVAPDGRYCLFAHPYEIVSQCGGPDG